MNFSQRRSVMHNAVLVSSIMLACALVGYAQSPFNVDTIINPTTRTSYESLDQTYPDKIDSDQKNQTPGTLMSWFNSIVKIVSDLLSPAETNSDGVSKHIARSINESQKRKTAVGKRLALIDASYHARSINDIEALMQHAVSAKDREEIIRHAVNVVNTPEDIIKLAEQVGSEYRAAYVYVDWANKKANTVEEIVLLAKMIKPDMRGKLAVVGAMKCKTFDEFKKMYDLATGDAESMAAVCRLGSGRARNLDQVLRYNAITTTSDSKNWIVVADGLKYAKTEEDLKRLIAATGDTEGLRWLQIEAATNPVFADYIYTTLTTEREKHAFTRMGEAYQSYLEAAQRRSNPRETLMKQEAYENTKIFFRTLP